MQSQLSKPPAEHSKATAGHKPAKAGGRRAAAMPSADIPDKLYFRIGEVARLCAIQTYVLRFWESEFPQLRPSKSGTGQRLYRKRDVEMALKIRRLLYDEGFTIPGARQTLQMEARSVPSSWAASRNKQPDLPLESRAAAPLKVQKLRTELRAILGMLSSPVGSAPASQARSKDRRPDEMPKLFTE